MYTCVNLEVHPEVAGIAEGLTAVLTLVRFHPYVPHEVHVELGGCDESPGAHVTLEFLLPYVALSFCSGGTGVRVSAAVTPAAAAAVVVVVVVVARLSCSMTVAGPWG